VPIGHDEALGGVVAHREQAVAGAAAKRLGSVGDYLVAEAVIAHPGRTCLDRAVEGVVAEVAVGAVDHPVEGVEGERFGGCSVGLGQQGTAG
jgi:hypothetical protein